MRKGQIKASAELWGFPNLILVPTGQPPPIAAPFQRLLDERLICPWLPKMMFPWKQLLLLSIIDCLAGNLPFFFFKI